MDSDATTLNGVEEAILCRPMYTGQQDQNSTMSNNATTSKDVKETILCRSIYTGQEKSNATMDNGATQNLVSNTVSEMGRRSTKWIGEHLIVKNVYEMYVLSDVSKVECLSRDPVPHTYNLSWSWPCYSTICTCSNTCVWKMWSADLEKSLYDRGGWIRTDHSGKMQTTIRDTFGTIRHIEVLILVTSNCVFITRSADLAVKSSRSISGMTG